MAKPQTRNGAKKAEIDGKTERKSKVKGMGKKPFRRVPKRLTLTKTAKVIKKPPLPKADIEQPIAGVKRTCGSRDGESDSKRTKVSRPPLDRKERRVQRKSQRPHSELAAESKGLWEKLRRHDLKGEERKIVMETLMSLLGGHMYELSLKHDTARVVQSCLKNGTPEQRSTIFADLREHIVELAKLKYGKFTVKALLKYCTPAERGHVIAGLYGNVRRLIRHTEAAEIVETAYNDYANAAQRSALIQEFYGPTFALFKTDDSAPPKPLTQILSENSEHHDPILKHLKESLLPLCDKSVIKHSIVHRALLDYFLCCSDRERAEMIEHLREVVVNILHTKEGAKVTLNCLWHGTTKDRKLIIKSFKTYVRKICMEENGHLVLLGAFDCVDDTVLVRKALLSEIVSTLEEVCEDTTGRRVVLYLLAPRSPRHFSPQFINLLTPGDANMHSKKTLSVRWSELLEGVAKPLVALATRKVGEWCRSKPQAPLLLEIVRALEGTIDLHPLYEELLKEVCCVCDQDHLVNHPSGHWVLRQLLEASNSNKKSVFAEVTLSRLTAKQLQDWVVTNRGSFVVTSLLASEVDGVKGQVLSLLEPVMPLLRKGEFKGQQALLNELSKSQT